MAIIEAGTILALCGGEYSDKWTTGPFEVVKDFDQKEVVDAYREQFSPKNEYDEPDETGFIAWMMASNYIRDVPLSYSWYVGSYGDFSPVVA
jgi:hypothetical protein